MKVEVGDRFSNTCPGTGGHRVSRSMWVRWGKQCRDLDAR